MYEIKNVKASFAGIAELPQKEMVSLEDIQAALPSVFKRTEFEADFYGVEFLGFLKAKAKIVEGQVKKSSVWNFYALFKINDERVLVSFRKDVAHHVFVVSLTKGSTFEKHTIPPKGRIVVQREVLAL